MAAEDTSNPMSNSQSNGLSNRLSSLNEQGCRLNDDSKISENVLSSSMAEVFDFACGLFEPFGYKVVLKKTLSLYDCQCYFEMAGGPKPISDEKGYMKPDGGILFVEKQGLSIPILIVEDKVQGTNDTRLEKGLRRQSTGNAIERAAKNIRASEMIFAPYEFFPYVVFASGCDFHSSETISKRLEMMNFGRPNHYLNISQSETTNEVMEHITNNILPYIEVEKKYNFCIASIFVKAHKWDEMKHNSSVWNTKERVKILKKVIEKVHHIMKP